MQYCSKLSLLSQYAVNPGRRVNIKGLGYVYHAACVGDLLEVLNEVQSEIQKDYLAATCLLRSYEILNGKLISSSLKGLIVASDTWQQQHLLGACSFASSGLIDLNQCGLSQSGTWICLREEVTMALELRRPVRMCTGFEFVPSENIPHDM